MERTLKVYVKPGCPWCTEVVGHLRAEGYDLRLVDVLADPEAYAEMRRLTGQSKAPTVVSGELVLADCGVEELREFLERNDIQP
jgi:glutaredoxin 3